MVGLVIHIFCQLTEAKMDFHFCLRYHTLYQVTVKKPHFAYKFWSVSVVSLLLIVVLFTLWSSTAAVVEVRRLIFCVFVYFQKTCFFLSNYL